MSDHDLDPLPPDLAALLDAERAPAEPPPGAAERVLGRAERTLGLVPPGAPGGGGSSGGGGVPGGKLLLAKLAKPWSTLGALALGVAGIAGALLVLRPAPRPPTPPAPLAVALPARVPAPPEPAASIAPPVASATASASAAPPRAPRPAASAAPASDMELAAELALLEAARSAVGRGNGAAALAALEQHAKEHPRGRLTEEREALWIRALALLGRYSEARERAERFRARFPASFLGPSVESTVAGDSVTDAGGPAQLPR